MFLQNSKYENTSVFLKKITNTQSPHDCIPKRISAS